MNMKLHYFLSMIAIQLLLSACSSQPIQSINRAVIEVGETVGLIDHSTMKVPDYYSIKQLEKRYELGVLYRIDDMNCSQAAKRCQ